MIFYLYILFIINDRIKVSWSWVSLSNVLSFDSDTFPEASSKAVCTLRGIVLNCVLFSSF